MGYNNEIMICAHVIESKAVLDCRGNKGEASRKFSVFGVKSHEYIRARIPIKARERRPNIDISGGSIQETNTFAIYSSHFTYFVIR